MHRTSRTPIFIVTFMLAVLTPGMGGCNSQQIEDLKGDLAAAQQLLADVQQAKAEFDTAVATLPEGEERDRMLQGSAEAQAVIDKTQATIERLSQQLAEADDLLDIIGAGAQSAAPLLPVPWNALAGAVAGLAIGLIRAGHNRAVARRIAQSVDDKLASLSPEDAAAISLVQGATGKRVVDEAEGKVLALPF